MRYSSNCSKEIYDKFIGEKMELGGDILCAQKLEQGTIPHASLLLLSIRYLHLPSKLPAHILDLGQYLNPIGLLFEMTMMNIWRTTCFPALVAYTVFVILRKEAQVGVGHLLCINM